MHKYKVKAGRHTDEKGKLYEKGDIVTTELNLTEKFPHKFEDLGPAEEEPKQTPAPKKQPKPTAPTKAAAKPKKAPAKGRRKAKEAVPATGDEDEPPTQDGGDNWED